MSKTISRVEFKNALRALPNFEYINFYEKYNDDNTIILNINICSTRGLTPNEARALANNLKVASDIADSFKYNNYTIL